MTADDVCRAIIINAANANGYNNPNIASAIIGGLLRDYEKVLVSAKKNPDEELISVSANLILTAGGNLSRSKLGLERDHAIPIKVLVSKILGLSSNYLQDDIPSVTALKVMLQDHLLTVTLTKDEHDYLGKSDFGLKAAMPLGWAYDDNWLARYEKVGIQVLRRSKDGVVKSYYL